MLNELNFNFNVNEINLDSATTDGFAKLESGWYKIALAEVSETRNESSGAGIGASFTFRVLEGPCTGQTFRKWFCVQAIQASAKWRQTNFENYIVRIAQCVGVSQIQGESFVEQLLNKPFYAYIVCKEREFTSNQTDRDGNFITKKTVDTDFAKGKLIDNVLSCAEYEAKNADDISLKLEMNV